MDTSNKISVIITTYNRRQFVERAIQSVLQQTHTADEIICIDDGSTDGTDTFVKANFPKILYYRQENKGISNARNEGIHRSTGNWLAFLDSDDTWHPRKLEKQMKSLSASDNYLICHTNEIWIRNGRRVNQKKIHQKYGGEIYQRCLPLCIISPSSVVIHRSVFIKAGLFDETMPVCEDYDLWLRICLHFPVCFVDEPLIYKYGGHDDQLSQKYWGMDRFRIYALENILTAPGLAGENKQATIRELIKKTDVYISGCKKRNKTEESALFTAKRKKYLSLLDS